MGKLGVIGGMGPEATAFFYEEVIKHTDASRDQEHLDMVIISQASMPDRTHAILTGDDARLLQVMREDAQALETLGCTCIAIPCNTSHYFYDKIQSFTSVPIIHMPREAVREAAQARRARRIGIMGTDGTVRSGVYARECDALGVECMVPSPERQADVMSIIYENVKAGYPADMGRAGARARPTSASTRWTSSCARRSSAPASSTAPRTGRAPGRSSSGGPCGRPDPASPP